MGYKIAITGGIGSGKSTVNEIIKAQGYKVFSCDEIYKELIDDASYVKQIAQVFPDAVENGCIHLMKLASIVFNNANALQTLNAIAHPRIMNELLNQMNAVNEKVVFAEVPLLFEGGYENIFDKIIVVERNLNDRIESVMNRSNLTREEVLSRIQQQFPYDTQNAKKHFIYVNASVIQNVGDLNQLKNTVLQLLERLLTQM